jgi:hypothetical protein
MYARACNNPSKRMHNTFLQFQPEDFRERELEFLRRRLLASSASVRSSRPAKMSPTQNCNTRTNTAPAEVSTEPHSDMRDMKSYSDSVLKAYDTVERGWQESSCPTLTLETIAETDTEVSSSLPASGRTGIGAVFTAKHTREGGGENGHLYVREDDSSFDSHQPRVVITSNVTPVASSFVPKSVNSPR